MKKFEIISYNYSSQQIEIQIHYPVGAALFSHPPSTFVVLPLVNG